MMAGSNEFLLRDEVALVTGGGTGLGLGAATALADAGAKVIIVGRRSDVLEQARESIGRERCTFVGGDVTHQQDRERMLSDARHAFGCPVTILVNSAGIHLKKPAENVSDEEFQTVMATHVNAAFAISREAYRQMKLAGHGSIVFIASMTSFIGMPNVVAYTAAKCAVVGLTRALAADWSKEGIRVNAVAPGWIESPMLREALADDAERVRKILSRTPMGRFGSPEDIGAAVVYLCSPAARFVNGVVFPVDGGASMGF